MRDITNSFFGGRTKMRRMICFLLSAVIIMSVMVSCAESEKQLSISSDEFKQRGQDYIKSDQGEDEIYQYFRDFYTNGSELLDLTYDYINGQYISPGSASVSENSAGHPIMTMPFEVRANFFSSDSDSHTHHDTYSFEWTLQWDDVTKTISTYKIGDRKYK